MQQLNKNLGDLSAATTWYLPVGSPCRIIDVVSALETTLTTGDSTITISDGTTTVGTITITQSGCAAGDIDKISFDSTSEGKVKFDKDTPIKIACDATPGQGKAELTLVLDEFHGDV